MEEQKDKSMTFWREFNKVLMDRRMPPDIKVEKILHLQQGFDVLPTQQAKWNFQFFSNVELAKCYVLLHKKYLLSPLIAQCKELLLKTAEYDFSTQAPNAYAHICGILADNYQSLADICQSKNHQRDVAYCYEQVVKLWELVGDVTRKVRALILQNVALSKIPNQSYLTREQILQAYPERTEFINKIFDDARCLKYDPVEQSQKYLDIYDEAEKIIQDIIEQEGRLARCPQQYWNIKREVLKEMYDIDWHSPALLNKGVRF